MTPFRIGFLDHVVLRVRDMERMIAWYRDVLGCPLDKRQDDLGLVHMRAGSSLIDLLDVNGKLGREGGPPAGDKARNVDHFAIQVEPFDGPALRAHFEAHGIAPGEIKERYGAAGKGPSMYITDPEGNGVELKGPPGPVEQ
jgi:catechol 2,3-dioxygenase-like lactoylglutathione lyase family enzyme